MNYWIPAIKTLVNGKREGQREMSCKCRAFIGSAIFFPLFKGMEVENGRKREV